LETIEEIYRSESRRVLATLIRLLGDFDLAEEALHDAFASAAESWPRDGIPENPRAWLVSTGRFKTVDRIRQRARFDEAKPDPLQRLEEVPQTNTAKSDRADTLEDDRRRLIFTCGHPALVPQAQAALSP
jgi:RNA polymerase sigma-70 factor (ECF subfamily)